MYNAGNIGLLAIKSKKQDLTVDVVVTGLLMSQESPKRLQMSHNVSQCLRISEKTS